MAVNFSINVLVNSQGAQAGASQVNSALGSIERRAQSLQRLLATVFSFLAIERLVRGFVSYGNALQLADNRLRVVAGSSEALAVIQRELFESANRSRTAYEDNVVLFQRVDNATKNLGLSQRDVLGITETLNKAIVASGASASEASAGVFQFTQALAKGRLDGDELRSVLENLPKLAELIAKGFGVATGDLRRLGEEGKLTTERIVKVLQASKGIVDSEFAKTVPTLAQQLVVLRNNTLLALEELEKATGVFQKLGAVVDFVAQKIKEASNARVGGELIVAFKRMEEAAERINQFMKRAEGVAVYSPEDRAEMAKLYEDYGRALKVVDDLKKAIGGGIDDPRAKVTTPDAKYVELLRHTNAELDREVQVLRVGNEERESLNKLLQVEEKLRQQGTPLAAGDRDALSLRLRQLRDLKRALDSVEDAAKAVFQGMEDSLVSFVQTGKFEFKKFADAVIADLVRIALRAYVTNQLVSLVQGFAGGLFGGGLGQRLGGSGFDLGFGGGSTTLNRFAGGGSFTVGGSGPTDSKLVAFMATPGERVDVSTQGSRGSSAPVINIINNASGTETQTSQRTEAGGLSVTEIVINAVGKGVADGSLDKALGSRFGVRPAISRR